MKNPFIITFIIFILFVVLVVFSVFKGPIEKEIIIKNEDPMIIMNRAVSSGDVTKCEGEDSCETLFVFSKAMKNKDPNDCNEIQNEASKSNCMDNVWFLKATAAAIIEGDKTLCSQIKDTNIKSMCEGMEI